MPSARRRFGPVLVALAFVSAPFAATAADTGPQPGEGQAAWDGETWLPYADAASGVAFEVPISGFRVEARHLDPKSAPDVIKTYFVLSGPEGAEVEVDLFDNPDRLGLKAFFDKHLAKLFGEAAAIGGGTAGPTARPAVVVDDPPGPHAYGEAVSIFEVGPRVVTVTCIDTDDLRAVAAYLHVLDTLRAGAKELR